MNHWAWAAASPFETCAKKIAVEPAAYESYRCYYEVANSSGDWEAAGRHLAALAAARPEIDWIVFARASVTWPLDKRAAERLYIDASRRFETSGNIRGEVLARANLHILFYESGRTGSAAREVERVKTLAERAQDPEVRIRARIVEAQFLLNTVTDLGRAYRVLRQAEDDLDSVPTYWLRQHVLNGLGSVLVLLGQYDDAMTYFRRLQAAASLQQDLSTLARSRLNLVNAMVEKRSEAPQSVDAAQLLVEGDEALAAARHSRDINLELSALGLLGEMLMADYPERARGYINTCVEVAEAQRRSQVLSQCLWIQGRLLVDADPISAQRAIDAAIDLLEHEQGTDYKLLAIAWRHAMRIAWQTQAPAEAIATGMQALAAIERLRDLQPDLQSRADAFSPWTQDYYWLSGQILRLATDAALPKGRAVVDDTRSFLDEAFQIGERMRARSLLDRLKAPSRAPVDLDEATMRRHDVLSKSIVDINRQLLKSKGHPDAELMRTLEALERQQDDARAARVDPRVPTHPVSLAQVQQQLAADEALLSFQIGLRKGATDRFAGGAWLFAVTRERVRVFELPDRHALDQSLALFKGLIDQSSAHRARASLVLYNQLLRDALETLPASIDRLIVVPDSPLDTFPLSALNRPPTLEPLARDYEVVLVPSATIWHDWQRTSARVNARPTLVLADPLLEFATDKASAWRSWFDNAGLTIGPLPHARAEGLEIVERLRGQGLLWTGAAASEEALKASDLSRYSVLHFATHTVIDSVNTDRSAILLASGTSEQDGLLQSREIVDLGFDDVVVVLSSCRSATGTQVRGEGVMGLARSFFAAGARVVIGSLWPIRDDHARAFFDPFYAALAEGQTVGAAFHHAQRRLIDDGLPMQAWAGFVLMGDAKVAPVSRTNRWNALVPAAAIAALLLLMGFVAILYSRKSGCRVGVLPTFPGR